MGRLGRVRVGKNYPVRIMGILNASPESFLASSVRTTRKAIAQASRSMADEGADIIDIGGMSSAPYRATFVSVRTEIERVVGAVRTVADTTNISISVDTCRAEVADAALREGATIVNDVTGLHYDAKMREVIGRHDPSLILCAHSARRLRPGDPVAQATQLLKKSVRIARSYGAQHTDIVLDPAIGFFRNAGSGSRFTRTGSSWPVRDLLILGGLGQLASALTLPLLVSVSNKSFLGELDRGAPAARRLSGSLAAEATAAVLGASMIRTHNVGHTRRALGTLSGQHRA